MVKWINLLEVLYPIGSIYQSTKSTPPSQSIGRTWKQIYLGENFLVPKEVLSNDL